MRGLVKLQESSRMYREIDRGEGRGDRGVGKGRKDEGGEPINRYSNTLIEEGRFGYHYVVVLS